MSSLATSYGLDIPVFSVDSDDDVPLVSGAVCDDAEVCDFPVLPAAIDFIAPSRTESLE